MNIATRLLGVQATTRAVRHPIRTDHEIEAASVEEVQLELMKLEALREEDVIPSVPRVFPTTHRILHQERPRGALLIRLLRGTPHPR
jgi:hypothetical protein